MVVKKQTGEGNGRLELKVCHCCLQHKLAAEFQITGLKWEFDEFQSVYRVTGPLLWKVFIVLSVDEQNRDLFSKQGNLTSIVILPLFREGLCLLSQTNGTSLL